MEPCSDLNTSECRVETLTCRMLQLEQLAGTDSCDAAVTDLYLCQIANAACVDEELTIYCSKERFECEEECLLSDCDILSRWR